VFTATANDCPAQGIPACWFSEILGYFLAFRLVDVHGGLQETWPRDQYRQVGEKA